MRAHPKVSCSEQQQTCLGHAPVTALQESNMGVARRHGCKLSCHADTRITAKHYAHLADRTLAPAVTTLPSFGEFKRANVTALWRW